MKKVLIIMESMQGGGAEKVFLDLLDSIDRSRYQLELLLVFKTGALLNRLPEDMPTSFLYSGKPKGLRRVIEHFVAGRDFLYGRDARRFASGREWDVVISFMEGPALKIHNALRNHSLRNITWVHINLNVTHWTKFLYHDKEDEAADYEGMDEIVFVSEGAKEAFEDKFAISGPHLHVIPNIIPVNTIREKSKEFKVPTEKLTICTVGRLVGQKRFDRLIDAVALIAEVRNDFKVWILGTGKLEKQLKEQAAKSGLEKYIEFLGFRANPYPYVSASDIFVLSSDTEGYPTVICEAMSLGKPIVSTSITGSKELLGHDAGLLTDTNHEALADGILTLMENTELAMEYAERARDASEQFDKDKILTTVYALIDGK